MLTTVKLLGELGRRFGREFRLDIQTAAEGLRALMSQIPGLREYIRDSHEAGIVWRVVTEDSQGLDEEGLHWPCSQRLVIAPQPAGRGAVGRILGGAALIAVGALVSFGTVGGGTPFVLAGVGMIFGGIAQLITPTPITPTRNDNQKNSFTFDRSNVNTQQGGVIPVLYGERIIGNMPVLSFGIELKNSL
jgi:predicted phage tail protein